MQSATLDFSCNLLDIYNHVYAVHVCKLDPQGTEARRGCEARFVECALSGS